MTNKKILQWRSLKMRCHMCNKNEMMLPWKRIEHKISMNYVDEMEICNHVDTEIVREKEAQILTRHLDHKPLVTLHLTRLMFLPMKLHLHLLPTLHFLYPTSTSTSCTSCGKIYYLSQI